MSSVLERPPIREHKLTVSDLKSKSRKRLIVVARNKSMYQMRKELKLSLTEIGQLHGCRDHSTVLNGLKNYKAMAL